MAISTQLQCFFLLVLCHRSTSECACSNSCDVRKNYLILFDEFQSKEELRATQVYVSKLARMLRFQFEDTRVAVGTFNGIKSSIRDSDHRKSHAFEQAILDLDVNPSTMSHFGTALSLVEPLVKDSQKFLSVLLIIASKGKDDAENTEFKSKATALSRVCSDFALYTLGIGESIHEGTFIALGSGISSGGSWKVAAAANIENVEGQILSKLFCGHISLITRRSNPTGDGTITIYSETDFQGKEKTIKLNKGDCINLKDTLGAAVKSIKNNKTCIRMHDESRCIGAQKTIFDTQSGLSDVPNSANNIPYDFGSLCPTGKKTWKTPYLSIYVWPDVNYNGVRTDIPVNCDGRCINLNTEEKKIASIEVMDNCVVLYDTINCVLTTKTQRIAEYMPKMLDLELENRVQSIEFCNKAV